MRPTLDRPPTKILVINVCRIGDTLLAVPSIRALAKGYPEAEITVLAHPKRVEVLANLPFAARIAAITKTAARARGWLSRRRYALAFVYGFDEALVSYEKSVASRVVALRQKDERLNQRLYRAVEPPRFQAAHSVLLALTLVDEIGVPHAGYRLAYHVSDRERAWATGKLRSLGIRANALRVGLQIASFPTKGYRDWPEQSFAALGKRILERWPRAHFLVFGGEAETRRTAWLEEQLRGAATSLAGKLTLRETAALMSLSHANIGVDTGPTHLMGCFDIPLVGLYHCYSPSRLIGALEHPCFYPVDHPRAYPCSEETPMAEITVDTVFAAVERALAEKPRTA